ncbi:spore cortex protein [Metabacillus niabensis]|uniref:Spore cortex protein n=2 Tax=Metabacillus niabensis TaxID=324854 RepID=A0ABT9YXT0_9BACI|nr:spore cortex protein [Metabacillus niabensis]
MNMPKKFTSLTAIALLTTGLSACNGNNDAMDTNNNGNNGNAQPIGYYSNENTNVENEGPVTEMMDGMNRDQRGNGNANQQGGYFRRVNDRNNDNDTTNRIAPLGNEDNGLVRDNRYSRSDANYHGHLNDEDYYNRGDRQLSDKVSNAVEKMDNVENANVLVTDDNIIVAVDTNDNNNRAMKDEITKKVKNMAKGRNIQVVTDEATITRVRNISNNMNNGGDRKTIDADITELMNDIGDTIRRPFNGNQNQ